MYSILKQNWYLELLFFKLIEIEKKVSLSPACCICWIKTRVWHCGAQYDLTLTSLRSHSSRARLCTKQAGTSSGRPGLHGGRRPAIPFCWWNATWAGQACFLHENKSVQHESHAINHSGRVVVWRSLRKSVMSKVGGADADVRASNIKAWWTFAMLSNTLRSTQLSQNLKPKILRSNGLLVLLNGLLVLLCEIWKVNRGNDSCLQVIVNRCLRRILRIHWPDTISNEILL